MECVFCKIVNGELPVAKVYEDSEFLVFLDAFPKVEAQTLVVPKEHTFQKLSEVPDDKLRKGVLLAKRVAKNIDSKLGTWSCLVIEGLEVPHFHIKIYPLNLKKGDLLGIGSGSKASLDDLRKISKKIKL